MAWGSLLPRVLLLLPLLAGSHEVQELQRMVGQTLSVKCKYPTSTRAYERKSLCKEVSAYQCISLVSSSQPGTLVQASRFSIWDNPSDGTFIVTMSSLMEEDSGHYWCRTYHASGNSVSKSMKFYVVVSTAAPPRTFPGPPPRPLSTASTRTPSDKVPAQTLKSLVPTTEDGKAPRPSSDCTAMSQKHNVSLSSRPATPDVLIPVLCGLLTAKSLMLVSLFALVLRNRHVQHKSHGPVSTPQDPRWMASLPWIQLQEDPP